MNQLHLRGKAYSKVLDALRKGIIKKPECCQECKSRTDHLDAHHEDYTKPLDVIWLCSICHHKRSNINLQKVKK